MKKHPSSFRLALCALAAGFNLVAPAVEYVASCGPGTVDTRRPDLVVASLDTALQALVASTQPVAWTILNQGAAPTPGGWVDRVYLSTNAAGNNGRLLGEFPASGPLGTNQSLPRFQTTTLPADLEPDRDYWWVVVTDAGNAIDESNEANNTRVSDQPIRLLRSPTPNLRVTSVSASASPRSGQPVTVTWAVTNSGTWSTGAGLWQDAVYVSATTNVDGTAHLLGRTQRPCPLGTNEGYASSLATTLPQGLSGIRYFIVQTDADNRVNEGVFENDNTTASAPVAITLTPPPDLRVAAIQAPTNGLSGATLAVSWTITNAGPGLTAEAAWYDDAYLAATNVLGTNAVLLGSFLHEGVLTNGRSYTVSASISVPVSLSGTFYLLVQTDARSNVFEDIFETNNAGASAPIVITLTPPPDLAVQSVSGPPTALASHPLTINYAVTNQGADTLFDWAWEDRLYLAASPATGARTFLSAQWHLDGLSAGGVYTNAFTATLPDGLSGAFYAVVETDSGNDVFELVKTNNARASAKPILVEFRPADLVVASLAAPSTAQAGGSLLVSWSVRNQGTGDSAVSRWSDRLVLSADATPGNADDVTLLTLEHNGLLAPGAGYTVSNQVATVPFSVPPGSYRLFLLTDSDNTVYEGANEANNASAPYPLAITRTTADLRVAAVSLSPPRGEGQGEGLLAVFSEDTLLVSWRVENTGSAAPNSTVWSDAIYLSTNAVWSTNSILLGINQNPSSLAPGASYTNTLAVTLPAEIQGTFFVHVVADAAGQVIESSEVNNSLAATNTLQVTLRPVPDLAVVSVATPADGFSGQLFDLSWTVTNRGPATAEGTWYDSVYLSLDPQFEPDLDTYIGYAERPATLTNGQSYTQTAFLEIPPDVSGLFYVFVVCDSTGRVNERGATANNVGRAAKPVSVWLQPPADLVVGTITIPTNAVAGYEMALTYILRNQGTNAAFGPWADALYLSTDDQWDISDTLFTRVSQTGFLAAGGSRTNTVSAPAPGVLPGNYHVIIRTDIVNQVPETNEFNNITATLDRTAVEVQELTLGLPATNQLATSQSRYYRVHVSAGQWLVIELGCAAPTASTELFVRYGAIPTRSEFDFIHSNPLQPNHRIVVPNTREGDYYILAYGDMIPSPGSAAMTLTARLSQFLVFDTSFGQGGNAGNLTIPINGVDFDRTCTARLTNATSLNRPALAQYFENSTRFYATLDLQGLAPGLYTVAVQNGDGSTVTIPDSVQVVAAAGLPSVIPVVSSPSAMRRNVAYQFTVQWGNSGLNDAPAPLLTVGNTVPFGLNPGDYSLGTRYTFLGINTHGGPPGILRPGQTEMMTFYSYSGTEEGTYTAFADRLGKNGSDPMDWSRVLPSLPSDDLARTNFNVIWNQFTNQIGGTWNDYLSMVSRNASLLPPGMGNSRMPGDLERLEWLKALTARTLSISGRVTSDSALVDVGNVQVVANPTNGLQSRVAWTLTDGAFYMPDLTPALYSLDVRSAQGRLAAPVLADTGSGQSVTNSALPLRAGAGLDLQITEAGGRVVPNAWITIGQATNSIAVTVTDSRGMASLRGLPDGVHSVFVEAQSFAPLLASVTLADGATVSRWLTLSKGAEINGTVTMSGALPPPDRLFILAKPQGSTNATEQFFGNTDANAFKIVGLPQGTYELYILIETNAFVAGPIALTNGEVRELGIIDTSLQRRLIVDGRRTKDASPYSHQDHLVMEPFLLATELSVVQLPVLMTGIFGPAVGILWAQFLAASPDQPARGRQFGSASEVVKRNTIVGKGFSYEAQNDGAFEAVLGRAASLIQGKFNTGNLLCTDFGPDGQRVFDLSELGISPQQINIDYDTSLTIAGNIAGGQSGWLYEWGEHSRFREDLRTVQGKVVARLLGENTLQVASKLTLSVVDSVDFRPGGIGRGAEVLFTVRLQFLESFGHAWGVPYVVEYADNPERTTARNLTGQACCKPENCDPCKGSNPPDSCKPTPRPVSVDPNDIVGPGGFGTEHWLSPDQTFHYTVRFENDPKKAEVPAQYVRITQQLSTNLDLRTFRLGVMGFGTNLVDVPAGRAFYQTQVYVTSDLGVVVDVLASLDLAKGVITWEFTSLDPATGDLPFDPFVGFLPPNTNGIIGQGFVSYTIKPKAGIASGDIINAEARIYFDYNEPMDTPHIFNTVDGNLPTSTILTLPLATNRNVFPVQWAGADGYGGAGIGGFDIYVSDNSGPWQRWLQNTPYWEQLFVGECGHTYGFYSVARDNVGNQEAGIAAPQSQIYVLPNTPPVLEPITNRLMAVGQSLSITNRAPDPDAGQQVTFSLAPGAPAGMSVNSASGVLKWTPACVQGGSSNNITVLATDDGCGSLSGASSFAVVVTECLQTSLGRTVVAAGGGGCVPVSLESGFDLTNLTFTVSVPGGRFTDFTVAATAPEVGSATVVSFDGTQAVVVLAAQPGQVMRGPKQFAQVCFALVPGQPSAFAPMEVQDILGLRENGTPIGNASGNPGRTVVVGEEPLLECVQGTNGQPLLILYGKPASDYAIDTRTNITEGSWQNGLSNLTVGTNLSLSITPPASSSPENFYRAVRAVQPGLH